MAVSPMPSMPLPREPAAPSLGVSPGEMRTYVPQKTCKNVHTIIYNRPKVETIQIFTVKPVSCVSIPWDTIQQDRRMNCDRWMSLTDILSQRSQMQRAHTVCCRKFRNRQNEPVVIEVRIVGAVGVGGGY